MKNISGKLFYLLVPLIYTKVLFADYWYSLIRFELSYLSIIAWLLHGIAWGGIVYMRRSTFFWLCKASYIVDKPWEQPKRHIQENESQRELVFF